MITVLEKNYLEQVPSLLRDIAESSEAIAKALAAQKPAPQYVWVFTAEQCYDMDTFDTIVKTFSTEAAACKHLYDFLHDNNTADEQSLVDFIADKNWEVYTDAPGHYSAGEEGSYLSNHIECTVTMCEIE